MGPAPSASEMNRGKFNFVVGIWAFVVAAIFLVALVFGGPNIVDNGISQNLLGVALTLSAGLGFSSILNALGPSDVVADLNGNLPFSDVKFRIFGRAEIVVTFGSMAAVGILVFGVAFPNQTKKELETLKFDLKSIATAIGTDGFKLNNDNVFNMLSQTKNAASSANKELTYKFGTSQNISALKFIARLGEKTNNDLKTIVQDRHFLKRLLAIKMELGGDIKGCGDDQAPAETKWIFITAELAPKIIDLQGQYAENPSHLEKLMNVEVGNDYLLKLHLVKSCDYENYKDKPAKFSGESDLSLMLVKFAIENTTKKIQTIVSTTENFRKQFLYDDKELAEIIRSNHALERPEFWGEANFQGDLIDIETAKQIAVTAGLDQDAGFLCEAMKKLQLRYSDEALIPCPLHQIESITGTSTQDSLGINNSNPEQDDIKG